MRSLGFSALRTAQPVRFDGMELGLFQLMTRATPEVSTAALVRNTREMVQLGESVGFDIAWIAEHHFSNYSVMSSPLMMVAHLAAATSTIRLGPAVVVLPFYDPLRLAQEVCLVDAMTGGRLVLGVGYGYQPREFAVFDVDFAERYRRGVAVWDAVQEALTMGTVRGVAVAQRPVQNALRTFMVGSDPLVVEHAAEVGAVPFAAAGVAPLATVMASRQRFADAFARHGVADDDMPFAIQRYVHVTDDPSEARAAAEEVRSVLRMASALRTLEPRMDGAFLHQAPYEGEPTVDDVLDRAVIGSAAHVAERIIAEADALGITHYSCFMGLGAMPHDVAMRSLERFGSDVMSVVLDELDDPSAT